MLDARSSRTVQLAAILLLVAPLAAATASAAPRAVTSAPPGRTAAGAATAAAAARFDGALRTDDGDLWVMVQLEDEPAAVTHAAAMAGRSSADREARRAAGQAARAQVAKIRAAQAAVAPQLAARGAREVYRAQKAYNGIAVIVPADAAAALERIPGVLRVVPIPPEVPTNSTSVPFIGTPAVWANTIGLPSGALGTGISIGVIDTGIDYLHAQFGSTTNTLTDYQNEDTATTAFTTAGGSFPTAKVVGGTDFAGDAYTGGNTPVPDPNPMDCNGHGSHVSGSAAGVGVTTLGAPFTGPYDDNPSTYSALRIGPGTAPAALLYGLRVFGCSGSTGLTVEAIDWAMDPNGDDDISDHLDVINMSLGSNFGSANNPSSVASDNAALAGVIVVTSAGNAGDTFFISGSPGAATRAIATANSVDDGVPAVSVTVNSPGSIDGDYLGGAAFFGPAPMGQTANAVIADDPIVAGPGCVTPGPLATDACCALNNAVAMAGNICVVDRGTCSFKLKALNCQTAGAIGMVVVDNAPGSPPPAMADDPAVVTPITIPSERVTLADGTLIKNTITSTPPVNVTLNGSSGADTLSASSSRGPRRIFGAPLALKPDIAAPGTNITSALTGHGPTSGAFAPDSQPLTISGTSMASPHVAGIMALLLETHPTWTVEELKALVMNYALEDVFLFPGDTPPQFPPSRVGGGRVEPARAALGEVIAYNADRPGMVSVAFEQEVLGLSPVTRTVRVRVANKSASAETYDLAIDTVLDSPGVVFSLPGGPSVAVPASSTVDVDVLMTADPALMEHTRDPSLFPTQGIQANYGDQPRNFLTEEGAYLTFSQTVGPRGTSEVKLRLPLYMAERPASAMTAADTIVTLGHPSGTTDIELFGTGLCTGTVVAGPLCAGSFPQDVVSLVTPFELQVVSGVDPVNATDYADIQYVGTSFLPSLTTPDLNNDLVLFGVSSWGDWSTLDDVAYNICVDHNEDGAYDKIVVNSNPAIFVAGAPFNDNFVRVVRDIAANNFAILGLGSFVNLVSPNVIDSALHLNNVMVLGATPAQLGFVSTADTTFRYKVVTCPATNPGCADPTSPANTLCNPNAGTFFDQVAGPFFYNWGAPGLDFDGAFLVDDLHGAELEVGFNTANMTANGSLGALLLHHHNRRGTRAEVVLLDTAPAADLSISKAVDDPDPAPAGTVIFTVTVTNQGPNAASAVMVLDPLPPGLTYVSDDGGGAYDPATGLWTVGALAVSASATLNVTATADLDQQVCAPAQITGGTPLDPDPADNQATVCLAGEAQADLEVVVLTTASEPEVGETVTFTVDLQNFGPDAATSTTVQVTFPGFPGLDILSGVPTIGSFDSVTGVWTVGNLANMGIGVLVVDVEAPPAPPDLLTMEATAQSSVPDPNTSDNTDSASALVGGYFYSIAPCRVVDTRDPNGPYGGPVFGPATQRTFDANDHPTCTGIPDDIRALAVNITAVSPSSAGHLRLFQAGIPLPNTSVLNFISGLTRANNAIVVVDEDGAFTVFNSAGNTHVLVDVTGYFQ